MRIIELAYAHPGATVIFLFLVFAGLEGLIQELKR